MLVAPTQEVNMAGITGPVPNRSDQRVRRNLPDVPINKVEVIGSVAVPELGIRNPHPLVTDLYESLKDSAQSKYYEPSDWQIARLVMYLLEDMLTNTGGKAISSLKISAIHQMMTTLLMTEGDRRRVRMEVERNPEGGTVLDVADLFRQRLAQG